MWPAPWLCPRAGSYSHAAMTKPPQRLSARQQANDPYTVHRARRDAFLDCPSAENFLRYREARSVLEDIWLRAERARRALPRARTGPPLRNP